MVKMLTYKDLSKKDRELGKALLDIWPITSYGTLLPPQIQFSGLTESVWVQYELACAVWLHREVVRGRLKMALLIVPAVLIIIVSIFAQYFLYPWP